MIKAETDNLSIKLAESEAKNKQLIEYYENAIKKLALFEANLKKEREEKANEYNKIKLENEQLKKNESSLFTQIISKRLKTMKKQLADLERQNNVQKEQINQYQIEIVEQSNKIAILNKENTSIKANYYQLKNELDKKKLDFEKDIAANKHREMDPSESNE